MRNFSGFSKLLIQSYFCLLRLSQILVSPQNEKGVLLLNEVPFINQSLVVRLVTEKNNTTRRKILCLHSMEALISLIFENFIGSQTRI